MKLKKWEFLINKYYEEFKLWIDERKLRNSILFIKENISTSLSNKSSSKKNISNHLIKKIKSVTKNGKDSKALEIVKRIFE